MTFYKKLMFVLGLCILSNFAHAAAAEIAVGEGLLSRVTPLGFEGIPHEKWEELNGILEKARAGDPAIHVISGRDVGLAELRDNPQEPVRGGLENEIITDKPVVIWDNNVNITVLALMPELTPDRLIGGLVGRIKAPIIIILNNHVTVGSGTCIKQHRELRRSAGIFVGAYTGEMYGIMPEIDTTQTEDKSCADPLINHMSDHINSLYGLSLPEPAAAAGVAGGAAGAGGV